MTKEELHRFINNRFIGYVAGATYGYTSGELELDDPNSPVTEQQFRTTLIALQASIVDAFVELGLIDNR
jgi:hypothetical protein